MAGKKKTRKLPEKKIMAGGEASKRGSLTSHQNRERRQRQLHEIKK